MALAGSDHHTAPRGQKTASVITENAAPQGQKNAGAEYLELSSDEEVALARGMRPAPLSEVARPHGWVRHTVEQIVEFVPVVQILDAPVPQVVDSVLAVPEQRIVQHLPEACVLEHVARVWVPLMSFPSLDVPTTGLHDPAEMIAVLELDEEKEEVEEEEVLEMFDESIDRFEHSDFCPRRLCVHFMAGRCERGWSCTFAHGEQQLHPHAFREADRGCARAADRG